MKHVKNTGEGRTLSLYFETILWAAVSMAAAIALFFLLQFAEEGLYDMYEEKFADRKTEAAVSAVQEYITKNSLSSGDAPVLQPLLRKNDLTSFQIFMDGDFIYNYSYGNNIDEALSTEESYAKWEDSFPLVFSDGQATAYTDGVSGSAFMNFILVVRILLSFLLFFILIWVGVGYILRRLQHLAEDIRILETGSLDYEIRPDGRDEITELQKGLDAMRQSLKSQMDQEEYLLESNRELITEMSHDLRTPLTSVLMYTDLLKLHKYRNTEEADSYVQKVEKKAVQIKRMTDNMFEYALVGMNTTVALEAPEDFSSVFFDTLSDFAGYLSDRGFEVKSDLSWPSVKIRINTDYLSRIMDNIASNIEKYADRTQDVDISISCRTVSEGAYAGIAVENTVLAAASHEDSTGIGTRSMANMMHAMKGKFETEEADGMYRVKILFPVMAVRSDETA